MIALFVAIAVAVHIGWLLYASVIDVRDQRVPNRVTAGAAASGFALLCVAAIAEGSAFTLVRALVGAVLMFAVLLLFYLISRKSFGAADVKMGFAVGLHVGWFDIDALKWVLLIAWTAFGVVGGILFLMHRVERGSHLPFVPFLAFGSLATLALVVP